MATHLLRMSSISHAGARAIVARCLECALEKNAHVSVAVVDVGGHLLVFDRCDGASLASINVAQMKARTAALYRASTKALLERAKGGLLMLPLPDLLAATGGVPLFVGGNLIGALGVSGSSGETDELIANSGESECADFAELATAGGEH